MARRNQTQGGQSELARLLAAVKEDSDEDAPRLVLADWLEERGESDRAEFIRVQCRLAAEIARRLAEREGSATLSQRKQIPWHADSHAEVADPAGVPPDVLALFRREEELRRRHERD